MIRLLSNLFRKELPKPLGRWNTTDNPFIKADYANMDSCGDVLCGTPNHFTKPKTAKTTKTTNNKTSLDKYYEKQPDHSYSKFCYQNPRASRIERINKLTEFLHKTR